MKLAAEIAREDPQVRVFRVSDDFVDDLKDWSRPVQMRLELREDGTYDLICRTVAVEVNK